MNHLYHNNICIIIAESEEEASQILNDELTSFDDISIDTKWEQLPDDDILSIYFDGNPDEIPQDCSIENIKNETSHEYPPDTNTKVTAMNKYWAELEKGIICDFEQEN